MTLPFTGERPVPGATPDIIFDGVKARYLHAKRLFETYSSKKVLDVGCATGIGSGFLANCGFSVTGIDIDSECLSWGIANQLHPNLTLLRGREYLPFGNETFDGLIAFECIEHMRSPFAFILEAKQSIEPEWGFNMFRSVLYR